MKKVRRFVEMTREDLDGIFGIEPEIWWIITRPSRDRCNDCSLINVDFFLEIIGQILLLFAAYPMSSRPPYLRFQSTRRDFSVAEPAERPPI